MKEERLPPIQRSVSVTWNQETAFRRFTAEFGSWWPAETHSIGGDRVRQVVFETREGGLIYEELEDGRRFQWGKVLVWSPPSLVKFTWHPSRDASTAQEVEVEFTPEESGTRVNLTSAGWERLGRKAPRARRAYDLGWAYILNVMAGKRTMRMLMVEALTRLVSSIWKLVRPDAAIRNAGGEIQ